jgi:DNA-binding GntR family transcriptional regulator
MTGGGRTADEPGTMVGSRSSEPKRRRQPVERKRTGSQPKTPTEPARVVEPAYRTLVRELRTAINAGQYANGKPLPTEIDLAKQRGISRTTVRRAFHDLVAEGFVYRVAGRGTFAVERSGHYLRQFGSIDDLMTLSDDTTMRVTVPLHSLVDVDIAGRLRAPSDEIWQLQHVQLHTDVPFCVTTVSLIPAVARLLLDVPELAKAGANASSTIIALVDARLGDRIVRAEQSITAVGAREEVAARLGCAMDTPLIRVDRLYFRSAGEPVELAINYYLPAHYSYRVSLERRL